MRTSAITVKNAQDAVLMDYGYTYDAVGNIKTKTTEHGAYQYGYDALDRLTSADYPNGQNNDQINTSFDPNTFPFKDDQFTYDLLGNRITDQAQTVAAPWQYNANNELQNSALNLYSYNENGSTVEKKQPDAEIEQRYVYNTEERLAEVKDANDQSIASYTYDPFGRRLWKTVAANQPGNASATPKTTYLYYSDEGYAAEYTHAGNHPNSEASITPTLSQLYLFAPQGLWSTEPLAIKQSGEQGGWRYPETDHLGTPHGLISKTGEETTDLRVNAFGQTEVTGEPLALRFAGQTEDHETGGYYNYRREFDSSIGRYLSRDLIRSQSANSDYDYSKSNPLKYLDNLGLYAFWTGTFETVSAGLGYWGGGYTTMDLHTECVDGKKCTMSLLIVFAQGGLGLSPIDVGLGSGNVEVGDNTGTQWDPSPSSFNNFVIGEDAGIGLMYGATCGNLMWGFGDGIATPSCEFVTPGPDNYEWIIKTPSVSVSLGHSFVTSFNCEPCCD